MSRENLRKVYIEQLIELAKDNPDIVSLDSDSREATLSDRFAAEFPDRSFSFGIAEQDMVTAAAGMSTMGLIPFVNSYAMFIAMRALDQVRNIVAYPKFNVKMVLSHYGLDTGSDGVTHQLTEDIAIFRSIANLKLLQPADAIEMRQMVKYAVATDGPIIIKSGKSAVPDVHGSDYEWQYGVPSLISKGQKVAIVTNGVMVERALAANNALTADGIHPRIINMSSLTDVDHDALLSLLEGCGLVLTLEDHSIHGGIGGIVSEILSQHRPTKVLRLGMGNQYAECGAPDKLFAKHGMDSDAVIKTIKENL